jgi:hypothetical protein
MRLRRRVAVTHTEAPFNCYRAPLGRFALTKQPARSRPPARHQPPAGSHKFQFPQFNPTGGLGDAITSRTLENRNGACASPRQA